MRDTNYVVVGDIFKNPRYPITGILSESEAIEMILQSSSLERDVIFKIQQGVNVTMLEHAILHQEANDTQKCGRFVLHYGAEMPRAVRRLAHKMTSSCSAF